MNQLALVASLAQASPLRYTPAGLPALDMWLEHASEQREAGAVRKVRMRIRAVAFGTLAERLARRALESTWIFQGFLAAARGGKGVVFHIQEIQTLLNTHSPC